MAVAGGGGGVARHSDTGYVTPINGNLTIGGSAAIVDGSYYTNKCAAGGGAGAVVGIGKKSSGGVSTQNGTLGTGGLLMIYAKDLVINNGALFSAKGAKGGNSVAGGGSRFYGSGSGAGAGSGGGSINIFMQTITVEEGEISEYINVSGGVGGTGTGGSANANGGAGGTGSCNIGYINNNTYQSYYSNN